MRYGWSHLLTIVILVSAAGCRQPDGPIPKPSAEEENKIGDVSRDLLAVKARAASAVKELSEDLANFAPTNEGARHGGEMARRLAASLEGTKLSEDAAREIARDLFIAFSARELSRRQVTTLRDSLGSVLSQTGVQQATATSVLEGVDQVQADLTTLKRRWWQFF
jgi:hypothetical protein